MVMTITILIAPLVLLQRPTYISSHGTFYCNGAQQTEQSLCYLCNSDAETRRRCKDAASTLQVRCRLTISSNLLLFRWTGDAKKVSRQLTHHYLNKSHTNVSQLDDFSSLSDAADTRLFTGILHNPYHVLQALLTPPADHNYNLRDRPHNRQLPGHMSHLTNCNFTAQMLFCGSYWLNWLYLLSCMMYHCTIAVWQLFY